MLTKKTSLLAYNTKKVHKEETLLAKLTKSRKNKFDFLGYETFGKESNPTSHSNNFKTKNLNQQLNTKG